jgi:hypothetical protein
MECGIRTKGTWIHGHMTSAIAMDSRVVSARVTKSKAFEVLAAFGAKLAPTSLWPDEKITLANSKNWRKREIHTASKRA